MVGMADAGVLSAVKLGRQKWWAGRGSNPQREANKGTLGTNPRPTAVAQSGAACRPRGPLLYV